MQALSCVFLIASLVVAPLAAEESTAILDCHASFELGKLVARQAPAPKWFWSSFTAGALVEMGALVYEMYLTEEEDTPAGPAVAVCTTLGLSILLPLLIKPEPAVLPNREAVDPECYRRGFARKRRSRNTRASVLGFAAGAAAGYAVFAAIGFYGFMLTVE